MLIADKSSIFAQRMFYLIHGETVEEQNERIEREKLEVEKKLKLRLQQEKMETAKKLLSESNFSIEKIADILNLSVEDVRRIKNN